MSDAVSHPDDTGSEPDETVSHSAEADSHDEVASFEPELPSGRGGPQFIPRPAGARPGGAAPWAELPAAARRPTIDDIRKAFAHLGPPSPSFREREGTPPGSAVLAPLYEHDGEAYVILTRRTMGLRHHRGEVSFPGGRREAGEGLVEAALREANEEIGLDPDAVELVGELDHLATISSAAAIAPFVGVLAERPAVRPASLEEVDAVLHVALVELCDPAIYREEIWPIPTDHPIFFFELVGDTVWGATAALLRQLIGLATGTLGRGDLGHW